MVARVAEHRVRRRWLGSAVRYRVDLHGVSVFGPRRHHAVIRWEWMTEIVVDQGVVVRSTNGEIRLPNGCFGLHAQGLAERLRAARSIVHRPEIIGELAGHQS